MVKHFFCNLFKLSVLACLLTIPINSQDNRETDKRIKNAGMQDLATFLNKIPIGHERDYGFDNRDQFNQITPGNPIRLYCLPDESGDINNTDNAISPRNEWFLPLIVNNKYVALLTVSREGNNFTAVDFGAKDLATELNTHKFQIENLNDGTGLLRVYNIQSDFLMVTVKGKPDKINSIYPLMSARTALKLDLSRNYKMTVKETKSLISEKLSRVNNHKSDR